MNTVPMSLARRLSIAAAAQIIVASLIATMGIGFVLHRFLQGQIDQRLDTQIVFLSSVLQTDAGERLILAADANGPPFDRPRRGWYWQVVGPNSVIRSTSLGADLLYPEPKEPPRRPRDDDGPRRPRPDDGRGPENAALHFRVLTVDTPAGPAVITASAPRGAVWAPLREAFLALLIPLIVVAVLSIVLSIALVRVGLRPLQALLRDLDAVRAGEQHVLPERNRPEEVAPLVRELNALFAQNEATLERARRHVANLAHALKTPLATLAIAWEDRDRATALDAPALISAMERRIRHHLGRARMAALAGPPRTKVLVGPSVEGLLMALSRVFADRAIESQIAIPDGLAVACDQQDFDEIAGNILENAFKATTKRIVIHATPAESGMVLLTIEDDGPGIDAANVPAAMTAGQRLDEATTGYGFGLPIARELVELGGGSLALSRSTKLGGVCVSIMLPVASGASMSSS